jgi:hypothetical protein
LDYDPPASAYLIAGITGVNHHTQLVLPGRILSMNYNPPITSRIVEILFLI